MEIITNVIAINSHIDYSCYFLMDSFFHSSLLIVILCLYVVLNNHPLGAAAQKNPQNLILHIYIGIKHIKLETITSSSFICRLGLLSLMLMISKNIDI